MFTYRPIETPEELALFEGYTRRAKRAAIAMSILGVLILLLVPAHDLTGLILRFALMMVALATITMSTRPISFFRTYKSLGFDRYTRPALPYPLSLQHMIWPMLISSSAMGVVVSGSLGHIREISIAVAYATLMTGGVLAWHGWRARHPSAPCCTKCAYPIDTDTLPAECPECGKAAPTISHLTRTPRTKRPAHVVAGLCLVVFGVAMYISVMFKPAAMFSIMPRRALLLSAQSDNNAFARIDTDTLTPGERDRLISGVLSARGDSWSHETSDQLDWIGMLHASGVLSEQQAERYLLGDATLEIIVLPSDDAEPDAEPGVELSVYADLPRIGRRSTRLVYFFSGFEIVDPSNDGLAPMGRDTKPRPARTLSDPPSERERTLTSYPSLAEYADWPAVRIAPGTPAGVRARVVLVAYPIAPRIEPAIVWHEEGGYTVTPEPIESHELVAERVIDTP